MEEVQYLSIAEFAEAINVSKQAVYKRIKKDKEVAQYCRVINGRQCILSTASELFNRELNEFTPPTEAPEAPRPDNTKYLISQLEEKDRLIQAQQTTIASQTEQIQNLQAHIMEQSTAMTEMLRTQAKLQENYQILIAQQQKLLEEHREQPETTTVSTVENVEQPVEQQVEQPVDELIGTATQPKPRRSFFDRLFGRNS